MNEPLPLTETKSLIRKILAEGTLSFTRHAEQEMAKDGLAKVDVENVLRGGAAAGGEWENGSWRYRVFTARITVVVAFRSWGSLVVITAWRQER